MLHAILVAAMLVCGLQAIRASRLLISALWLAAASALLAVLLYVMGAREVAVIELSVGAGLVTVLFVFAISIAGEDALGISGIIPKPLAWGLVIVAALLLGWLVLPLRNPGPPAAEASFSAMLWDQRGADVLVQVVLIFSGVLGVLGLLNDAAVSAKQQKPIVAESTPTPAESKHPELALEEEGA
jgi:uncharacterized MnhB-related membrane protein